MIWQLLGYLRKKGKDHCKESNIKMDGTTEIKGSKVKTN
jgi:hypothetical protein